MDGDIKTTFVPRRPQLATAPSNIAEHRGPDFISLVATIAFVVSLVLCGGVFAWQFALNNQLAGQAQSLAKADKEFDQKFVDEAARLNDRIVAAGDILDRHVAPSSLLDLLERFTLRTVSFQSFSYTQTAGGQIQLSAAGVGESFKSIVLQSDQFGGPAQMHDVVFSRLEPNDQNLVTFNFSATVDPKSILYFRTLNQDVTSFGAADQGSVPPPLPGIVRPAGGPAAGGAATSSARAGTSL